MKNLKEKIKITLREFFDNSTKKDYEEIGPNNFTEALRLNGFSINKKNDPETKTIYFGFDDFLEETIDYEFEQKGGIITFSIEVNAEKISKNKLINWLKQKIETLINRLKKDIKINKVLSKYEEVQGVTIGNFVNGRYKAKDGSLYDETSLSIEIIGIDSNILNKVAEDLVNEFKQESVLVKNYETNKIYLVK